MLLAQNSRLVWCISAASLKQIDFVYVDVSKEIYYPFGPDFFFSSVLPIW